MKSGSTVECVRTININEVSPNLRHLIKSLPIKGGVYTIESIGKCPCCEEIIVTLKEIDFTISEVEGFGLPVGWFRELELPPSLKEEIEECLTRNLVLTNINEQRWN